MKHLNLLVLVISLSMSCYAQFGGGGFGGGQTGGDLNAYSSKKDIDYVGDNHVGHKLDIYFPNDAEKKHNVIIHIYGSAWGSNNSKGSADLGTVGKAALEAGYIFVTPNHRTYSDALYPAQIQDIKAVVRYLRGNAAELGVDTFFIAISGFSSGGHLASLMGVTRNVKKNYTVGSATMDMEGELGSYTDQSSWVDAVCDWSGPVDCRDKGCGNPIQMSPENDMVGGCNDQQCPDKHALLGANTFIDETDAPVMVAHGSADNIVPQCEGEKFANNLKAAGVYVEYYPHSGGHGVNGDYTDEMIKFFNNQREEKLRSTVSVTENKISSVRGVELAPNPTNGKFSVISDKGIVKVEVLNMVGEVLLSQNSSEDISVSASAGIYFVKAYAADGSSYVETLQVK